MLQKQAEVESGVLEEPVSFQVHGEQVQGIYVHPKDVSPKELVIFSHGWSGNKSGPAGILTATARHLVHTCGCACFRFDFRGRGESQGDGLGATLATMSEDLLEAVHTAERLSGIAHPVLFGMCSGGNIAIGSLKQLPEVKSMMMLSVYPFSDGDSFGRDVHRTWHFLNVYLHKACSLDTWRRLFKGEASLGRVFQVIFRPFLKRGENKRKEEGNKGIGKTAKASANESRLQAQNGKEPPKKHLANLRKELTGVMVYGTADPDAGAAREYFGKYVEEHQLPIRFIEIPGANHNFSSAAWHAEIARIAEDFCRAL